MTGCVATRRKGRQRGAARPKPTSRTEADWWNTEETEATPLRGLVEGMDAIGSLLIPYGRLPRRAHSAYAQQSRWSDIAGQTPQALLSRPKSASCRSPSRGGGRAGGSEVVPR